MRFVLFILSLILLVLFLIAPASATTYYVNDTSGSDTYDGNLTHPFKTIQAGADIVVAGDTVIVQNGTYTDSNGAFDSIVHINRKVGNATHWITFKSEHQYGAVLDGVNGTVDNGFYLYYHPDYGTQTCYVNMSGFEIKDTDRAGIYVRSPEHVMIHDCKIHGMGRFYLDAGCTAGTGQIASGITSKQDTTNVTVDRCVIYDIGRQYNAACGYGQYHWDHNIYLTGMYWKIQNSILYDAHFGWLLKIADRDTGQAGCKCLVTNCIFGNDTDYSNGGFIGYVDNEPTAYVVIQNNIGYDAADNFDYSTGHFIDVRVELQSDDVFQNNTVNGTLYEFNPGASGTGSGTPTESDNTENVSLSDFYMTDPDNNDFTPTSNSVYLIDLGISNSYTPSYDFLGVSRPQGTAVDIGAYETSFGQLPNLTSWQNNDTSDSTLDISVDVLQSVLFNVTSNQTATGYTWKVDGVDQSHSYDNFSYNWLGIGTKTVTVTTTSVNGTSSAVQWNVIVNCLTTSWYDSGYSKRKNLTIDHDYVNGVQLNHPVYINITDADLALHAQADGDDIIFVDLCTMTLLDNMKERAYESSTGHLEAWINVPYLYADSNTTIQMYYGNASATNTEDKDATWNSNFAATYLFAEDSGIYTNDSSGNNNNGTGTNLAWGRLGLDLYGSNEHVSIPNFIGQNADWTILSRFTQDTRNPNSQSVNTILVSMQSGTGTGRSMLFIDDKVLTSYKFGSYIDGSNNYGNSVISTGTTYGAALSQSGTAFNYYLDGVSDGSFTATANSADGNIILFDHKNAVGDGCFDGTVDYLMWYTGAMAQGTIETIHNNTDSPSTFIIAGTEGVIDVSPTITSWENNKTSDTTMDISLNVSEYVNFNVTADQDITTWNWYDGGIDQSNNYDNLTLMWTGTGLKTVIVNGTNANGTTASKQWNITVSDPDWYDYNWINMKVLTIDHTYVSDTQTNFPFLVNTIDTDLRDNALASGNDIIFTTEDNTTQLNHEIESWDNTTGELVAWVRIPSLSGTVNTTINMYYNNTGAVNSENMSGVWDSNFIVVHHLQETDIDGGAGDIKDSSGNNNNGTTTNMLTSDQVSGKMDGSFDFKSSAHPQVELTDIDGGSPLAQITVSAWVNLNTSSDFDTITEKATISNTEPVFRMFLDDSAEQKWRFKVWGDDAVTAGNVDSDAAAPSGTFVYVVGRYNGSEVSLWVNGTKQSSTLAETGNLEDATNNMRLGLGATSQRLNGILDEVRVSDTARSQGWIETEYNNTVYTIFTLGDELPGGDSTPPTYSGAAHNKVDAGSLCQFSITFDDETALESLGEYTFSTNNTGSWVYESAVLWSITPQHITTYKTLNTNHGTVVGYRWSATDNAGNANTTPIYTLTIQDTTVPASITGLTSDTSAIYWHNWTWTNPIDTDYSYTNIYINGTWIINSSTNYYNLSTTKHNTSIISTRTVDTTGNVNTAWVNHTSNIPNNVITISNISSSYNFTEGETLSIYADYTDADSDTGTFTDNSSDWIVDSSTGIVSWTINDTHSDIHYCYIEVSDGYSSTDTTPFTITIDEIPSPTGLYLVSKTTSSITWGWGNPTSYDVIEVYINDVWIEDITSTIYTASGLSDQTTYTIKLIAVYNGLHSDSISDSQTTSTITTSHGSGSSSSITAEIIEEVETIKTIIEIKTTEICDKIEGFITGNPISINRINFKPNPTYIKELYSEEAISCSIQPDSTVSECIINDGYIIITFKPDITKTFNSYDDSITFIDSNGSEYKATFDVNIISLVLFNE
ncbi:MAG: DUF2341 domain-containing protein [Candidatus Peribacteraceae bacterium]|nr:DUF2341 domain-containing protein [Candidatus Peribacteraceae bacterium]